MLNQAQNSKAFSNCQATYQKKLFEKSGNFFYRANVHIGLTPSHGLFLFAFVGLSPSMTNVLFECSNIKLNFSIKLAKILQKLCINIVLYTARTKILMNLITLVFCYTWLIGFQFNSNSYSFEVSLQHCRYIRFFQCCIQKFFYRSFV